MAFKFRTAGALLAVLCLAGCGGGSSSGGGSPSGTAVPVNSPDGSWLSFSTTTLETTAYQGESVPVQVLAKTSKAFVKPVNVAIIDSAGVITTDVYFGATPQLLEYLVQLRTSANLPAGVHSTNLQVRVCEDDPQVCRTPFPGSPWYVSLKVTVKPKAEAVARVSFSEASLDLATYLGEPLSFSINAKVSGDLVGQNYNVAAIDPAGLTVAPVNINANAFGISATFQSAPSLTVGSYTSNLEIRLCRDEPKSCKQPVPGSPWIVPLKLTVLPSANLSSLKAVPGLNSWSTYQGNPAHTGYVPASFDVSKFTRRWSLPAVRDLWADLNAAANDNGLVFLTRNGSFYGNSELVAISEDSGGYAWRTDMGMLWRVNAPAAANGRVYVTSTGSQDSYFWVFDQKTGKLLSKTAMSSRGGLYLAPTVVGTDIYTENGYNGGMSKFTNSGNTLAWTIGLGPKESWTPAVDGRYAYGYMSGYLAAVDLADGASAFELRDDGNRFGPTGRPVVLSDNNTAFVVEGGQLMAFDLSKRTRAWSVNVSPNVQPAYGNGNVYVFNADGTVLAVHASDSGNLLWTSNPLGSVYDKRVIVTKNLAFVSSNSRTLAIDLATHKTVWSYPLGGDLSVSSRGVLYILNDFGAITAINLQ